MQTNENRLKLIAQIAKRVEYKETLRNCGEDEIQPSDFGQWEIDQEDLPLDLDFE